MALHTLHHKTSSKHLPVVSQDPVAEAGRQIADLFGQLERAEDRGCQSQVRRLETQIVEAERVIAEVSASTIEGALAQVQFAVGEVERLSDLAADGADIEATIKRILRSVIGVMSSAAGASPASLGGDFYLIPAA